MKYAIIKHGDIGVDSVDLTVLPASGKLKLTENEPKRTQDNIKKYDLPSPKDMEHKEKFPKNNIGYISDLMLPKKHNEQTKYVVYATTSLGGSTEDALYSIGEKLGNLTKENKDIRLIELPLLGAGRGGIPALTGVFKILNGFKKTRHHEAILRFRNDNSETVNSISLQLSNPKNAITKTNIKTNSKKEDSGFLIVAFLSAMILFGSIAISNPLEFSSTSKQLSLGAVCGLFLFLILYSRNPQGYWRRHIYRWVYFGITGVVYTVPPIHIIINQFLKDYLGLESFSLPLPTSHSLIVLFAVIWLIVLILLVYMENQRMKGS